MIDRKKPKWNKAIKISKQIEINIPVCMTDKNTTN